VAIQRQLNFSRDAEREADRVGFQILRDAGFDPTGMVTFFGRLETSTRNYNDSAPAFLRSHPLTTERIADIQARVGQQRYKQHADSLEYFLIKSRVRVLQDPSAQGLIDAGVYFNEQFKRENEVGRIAAKYGLAYVAFKQRHFAQAQSLLDEVEKQVSQSPALKSSLKETNAFADLSIAIKLGNNQPELAVSEAKAAMEQLPLSRGVARQYAEALLAAKRPADAASFLRDQVQLYRSEPRLYDMLAKAYSAQERTALEHMALAEEYALKGALPAALQQLDIARRAPDAQYYDHAVIDAREREWKEKHKQELEDEKKRK
jgi:predicted Zn-dependent protease